MALPEQVGLLVPVLEKARGRPVALPKHDMTDQAEARPPPCGDELVRLVQGDGLGFGHVGRGRSPSLSASSWRSSSSVVELLAGGSAFSVVNYALAKPLIKQGKAIHSKLVSYDGIWTERGLGRRQPRPGRPGRDPVADTVAVPHSWTPHKKLSSLGAMMVAAHER